MGGVLLRAHLILLCVPSISGLTSGVDDYVPCTGLQFRFDGYSYILDPVTDERVWSHCSFPNPIGDHALCGRPIKIGQYYLCDPDRLLDEAQGSAIDRKLEIIRNKTSTVCTNSNGERETFRVSVVIINRIRLPDLQHPDLCINDCGQLLPDVNTTQSYPDDDEQDEIMKLFADGLRSLWQLGSCDNDVVVLYCKEFNKVYISAGTKASYYLPADKVQTLRETFKYYIHKHGFHRGLDLGLLDLLSSLKVALQGVTVAHIIVIVNMCVAFVLGTALFFYIFVKEFDMNVWGEEPYVMLWEGYLKLVSGVWLVQFLVMAIALMSHKGHGQGLIWALGTALGALAGCIALYYISLDVETYARVQ